MDEFEVHSDLSLHSGLGPSFREVVDLDLHAMDTSSVPPQS